MRGCFPGMDTRWLDNQYYKVLPCRQGDFRPILGFPARLGANMEASAGDSTHGAVAACFLCFASARASRAIMFDKAWSCSAAFRSAGSIAAKAALGT